MGESRKTELFLKGALSSPHCRSIVWKHYIFLLMFIFLETRCYLKTRGVNNMTDQFWTACSMHPLGET